MDLDTFYSITVLTLVSDPFLKVLINSEKFLVTVSSPVHIYFT